jgi:hypothetical protein
MLQDLLHSSMKGQEEAGARDSAFGKQAHYVASRECLAGLPQ